MKFEHKSYNYRTQVPTVDNQEKSKLDFSSRNVRANSKQHNIGKVLDKRPAVVAWLFSPQRYTILASKLARGGRAGGVMDDVAYGRFRVHASITMSEHTET